MSLRVPGAETPEQFWRNILDGRDSLTRPSKQELRATGVDSNYLADPRFVRARPLLRDIDRFDAEFFDMAGFEAERTDPAHRLFLSCVWECMERAGVVGGRNGPVTCVYAGVEGTYRARNLDPLFDRAGATAFDKTLRDPAIDLPLRLGNELDFFTARVAHKLDLAGPSMTVMAACATSLQAIHLGVRSLRAGECEVAIVGGASVTSLQIGGYLSGVEGMLSASGRLRPFDAGADGTIFGAGVGVVVLKPLATALADGNPIHAVIRGSAASNDGNPLGKESFIAPSAEGQIPAIENALADAEVGGDTIGLVEAHGTGTLLGDPVEVSALTSVYRQATAETGYCAIGSVKGNVGHLRAAAGVVGLIKACMALEYGILPPTANFSSPNPRIDFERSPFFVNSSPQEWRRRAHPRRAGVSAFGFGGSNVHVVVEEHREIPSTPSARDRHLLVLSARSEKALARVLTNLGAHLDDHPNLPLADVAHTLQCARKAWSYRACVCVGSEGSAPARLFDSAHHVKGFAGSENLSPIFLFPGQGAQRPGMGWGLYQSEETYRATVDQCADLLEPELGFDIRGLIHQKAGSANPGAADELRRTANAQPALFVVEYAMARLFMSWGLEAKAMLGHSVGEIVAACIGGVFSLPDALKLVASRSRLMQLCPPGAMAAVFMPQEKLEKMLPGELEIAAVNAPIVTVVSGPSEEVARFCVKLDDEGIGNRSLETSHAFHSRMMDPALPEFRALMKEIKLGPPAIPVISNRTGVPLTPEQATDPGYWSDHVRRTVNFAGGVEHLLAHLDPVFLEIGPGTTLIDLVRQQDADASVYSALGTDSQRAKAEEQNAALMALGRVWASGVHVDWTRFYGDESRRKVILPAYPFQGRRHWLEPAEDAVWRRTREELYEPGWRKAGLDNEQTGDTGRPWLIFHDEYGVADRLIERLKKEDQTVVSVTPGTSFAETGENMFCVCPTSKEDLITVLNKVSAISGGSSPVVLHLWSVTGDSSAHNTAEAFEQATQHGFHSLIALTQAAYESALCDDLNVLVIADGLARMDGEQGPVHSEKAALFGPCLTIAQELPGVSMRCLDLPLVGGGGLSSRLIEEIIREAKAGDIQKLIALREEGRFVEEMYAVPDLPLGRPRLREGGGVLITGGVGGLGILFAEMLFDETRARFVLTSRWQPPSREQWGERARRKDKVGKALRRVLALEARGAEVWIVRADVSEAESMAGAIAEARSHLGAIHGVIHAAGITEPRLAVQTTRSVAERVFAPKVLGAYHLETAFAETPLDLFIYLSSVASYDPAAGQVDYSAANAVLDFLARNRAARFPGLTCATAWEAWQETGMAVNTMDEIPNAILPPTERSEKAVNPESVDDVVHPVFGEHRQYADGRISYRGTLSKGMWPADEHRFKDRGLLCGTAVVEFVRAMFTEHAGADSLVELRKIALQRPLFVDDEGTEIEVSFVPEDSGKHFEVHSRPGNGSGPWHLNATGHAAVIPRRPRMEDKSLPDGLSPYRYPDLANAYITVGPRWLCVHSSKRVGGETWARLCLPEEFHGDLDHYGMHPALLDQASRLTAEILEKEAVPYTYDAVRVFGSLPSEVFVFGKHRTLNNYDVFDIVLTDSNGRILVEIDGNLKRAIEGSTLDKSGSEEGPTEPARLPGDKVAGTFHAVVSEPGDLESIRLEDFSPRKPETGEVQIEVVAAGLNFRDVLGALGQLPEFRDGPHGLGGECSGIVREVGDGVPHLKAGDSVVAVSRNAFSSHVTARVEAVASIPDNLSFEDAAGIPIVFLTADYAINQVANLGKGERILIHAASGGVGLAAVQLAQRLGAEIYATAGHPDKRAYLRELGVEHVMDTRSLDFVSEIREHTSGEGIDVVLNSLAGEFIPASLELLRSHGRFLEIGKRDINDNTGLGLYPFRNNLSFTAIDLGKMIEERNPDVRRRLERLMGRFACEELQAPPTSVFPIDEVGKGFQRMAHAEHIGKIVFQIRADVDPARSMARRFREKYGRGVSIRGGLEIFRRLTSSDSTPPNVLVTGKPILGAADPRERTVSADERVRPDLETAFRAPTNEFEEAMVTIWETTLGIPQIGIDDDFFDLGGDSITAIQTQYVMNRDFGADLTNTDFIQEPTIAGLAERIRQHVGSA